MTKKTKPDFLYEGIDYQIFDPTNDDDLCSVQLLTGPFNGITFMFDVVKPVVLENRDVRINYNYHITKGRVADGEEESFHEVVGDILYSILKTDLSAPIDVAL